MRKHTKIYTRLLSCLLLTMMILPAGFQSIFAAESTTGDSPKEPSLIDFADQKDLLNYNTASAGKSHKIIWGYKSSKSSRATWWIAGHQDSSSILLQAAEPITNIKFYKNRSNHDGLYPNFYGNSTIHDYVLNDRKNHFSEMEQQAMKTDTIWTKSPMTGENYSVYNYWNCGYVPSGSTRSYFTIGTNSSSALDTSIKVDKSYWPTSTFWLRTAKSGTTTKAMISSNRTLKDAYVDNSYGFLPFSRMSLWYVQFASSAPIPKASGKLTLNADHAYQVRHWSYNIGSAVYNENEAEIFDADKVGNGVGKTYLMAQNANGAWAKEITNVHQIVKASEMGSGFTTFKNAKVWLEYDSAGYDSYAAMANYSEKPRYHEHFATPQELTSYNTTEAGKSHKIRFGYLGDGKTPEYWWIAGSDSLSSAILQASYSYGKRSFASSTNKRTFNGQSVDASCYGGSALETYLNGLPSDTKYFTAAEKALMKTTKFYTKYPEKNTTYSRSAILYPGISDTNSQTKRSFTVGANTASNLYTKHTVDRAYWYDTINYGGTSANGFEYWLRSGASATVSHVNGADLGFITTATVTNKQGVKPAFLMDFSKVNFASSAVPATANGKLAWDDDDAYNLRYQTEDSKDTGTAYYYQDQVRVTGAPSGTYLVIQNEDGAWAKAVSGTMNVSIKEMNGALETFEGCHIWLERIIDGLCYAKEAMPRTPDPEMVIKESTASSVTIRFVNYEEAYGSVTATCSEPSATKTVKIVDGIPEVTFSGLSAGKSYDFSGQYSGTGVYGQSELVSINGTTANPTYIISIPKEMTCGKEDAIEASEVELGEGGKVTIFAEKTSKEGKTAFLNGKLKLYRQGLTGIGNGKEELLSQMYVDGKAITDVSKPILSVTKDANHPLLFAAPDKAGKAAGKYLTTLLFEIHFEQE